MDINVCHAKILSMQNMMVILREIFCRSLSLGTLVMRPAGNENKGAMKLRVDFKQKHPGKFISLFGKLEKYWLQVNMLKVST